MKRIVFFLMIFAVTVGSAWADCTNPCGLDEMLTCLGQSQSPTMTAKQYYEQVLFMVSYNTTTNPPTIAQTSLDGHCFKPGAGTLAYGLQQKYYDDYCQTNKGAYYAYENFANAVKSYPGFLCEPGTTLDQKKKELALSLATMALETTGNGAIPGLKTYTRDGLYWRYENGWLLGSDYTYRTPYFPRDGWMVAVKDGSSPLLTYTGQFWWTDPAGTLTDALIYDLTQSPVVISKGTVQTPSGYSLRKMNEIIDPGYWIGVGPKQLTGDSMMQFFGWYYRNIASSKLEAADFKAFYKKILVDGNLGFQGAYWYWMNRINGQTSMGYRPLHQMLTKSPKPVCQDMAAVTYMVNGGCNNYDQRYQYYQYYSEQLGAKISPVRGSFKYKDQTLTLDSTSCDDNIGAYCSTDTIWQ